MEPKARFYGTIKDMSMQNILEQYSEINILDSLSLSCKLLKPGRPGPGGHQQTLDPLPESTAVLHRACSDP